MNMTRRAMVWGIATAVLVGVGGCQGEAPKLPGLPGTTVGPETTALLAQLTAAGFTIEQDKYEPLPARYLRAPVVAVKVGGESLAIWEYPNPGAAADDGQRVSPRGIDGGFHELGTEAKWFLHGRVLVLYIGVEPTLRALLEKTLGPIFVNGKAA